jgi:hypothetical protein
MQPRIIIAALGLAATGLVSLAAYEGYTYYAIEPVPGDKPIDRAYLMRKTAACRYNPPRFQQRSKV